MKGKTIIQPNVITNAKYNYSVIEKRIFYQIINCLQYKMRKGLDNFTVDDIYVHIPIGEVVTNDNYTRVSKSAKSLMRKNFSISNPDGSWLEVGLISSAAYDSKTGIFEFEISKKIIPHLIELGKGFTSYSLNVALSLRSEYSQRFYEFCSRFKDTGVWNVSVVDLKEILSLEDKYPFYADFKRKILEVAKKEIKALYDKGGCDLFFVYNEKKTGRQVTDLSFRIVSEKKNKTVDIKNAKTIVIKYTELNNFLKRNLDLVCESDQIVVVQRPNEKSVVLVSLKEYNSMYETAYLMGTKANADSLMTSLEQVEKLNNK